MRVTDAHAAALQMARQSILSEGDIAYARFTTEWIPTRVHDTKDSNDLGNVYDIETILRCINILAAEIERLTARVERLEGPADG